MNEYKIYRLDDKPYLLWDLFYKNVPQKSRILHTESCTYNKQGHVVLHAIHESPIRLKITSLLPSPHPTHSKCKVKGLK